MDSFPNADDTPPSPANGTDNLVAVDIGNSQMKLGVFVLAAADGADVLSLPEPLATLDLPIDHATGQFDDSRLADWCTEQQLARALWRIGSVHRGAAERLVAWISASFSPLPNIPSPRLLKYQNIPIRVRTDVPARVGIDRLLAAFAANHLRSSERAAIVVDLGTAITVDVVEPDGAFAGGAILPGIGMAGRALAEQTDALPHVRFDPSHPPSPVGKSTTSAIEAGLFWGAVGAINELINQQAADLALPPDVFVTGGAGGTVAGPLAEHHRVRFEPHLVLAGIALLDGGPPTPNHDSRAES